MKLSGIVAPLALAGAASAAAIPKTEIESAITQVHSTLSGVKSLVGGVTGGSSSPAQLSEATNALKTAESKLQSLSVSTGSKTADNLLGNVKERQLDQVEDKVEGVVDGAEDKLEGATNLKERQLEGVENTVGGVVGGVKGQVEGATSNLLERQLPIGSLETILKGLFAKVQSGALTPEMLMGALNPSGVQSLFGGVLGGGALGHLETIIKGLFAKVQSGELTPEMILGALNPAVLQSLLGSALGNLL